MVLIADILLAISFVLQKKYQAWEGADIRAGLKFNIVSGILETIIFYGLAGFRIEVSLFSLACAMAMSFCVVAYLLLGFRILREGNTAIYSLFLMSGGMVLPYLFGIFVLNEKITVLRVIGIIVICVAVFLSSQTKLKLDARLIGFCMAVFVLNGFVSIISKVHQVTIDLTPVSSTAFVMYTGVFKFVLSVGAFLVVGNNGTSDKVRKAFFTRGNTLLIIFLTAGIGGVSYMLQLMGAKTLPASVLYPLITGGSIIFSAIAGRVFYKEKLSRAIMLRIALCFVGTLLFL